MNSDSPKNLGGERTVRDVSISRRGGVRTRGGRLPPINMRDLNQVMGTKGTKKMVAPNIPQRRTVIKKEPTEGTSMESLQLKAEPKGDSSRPRKGRSNKVFLQTEGSFLAEGPAARIKREQVGLDVGFSLPRVSLKGRESESKYEPEMIKDVLGTYDSKSFYDDYFCDKPPFRFPLLKQELLPKIKQEIEDDCVEVKIKKEVIEDSEVVQSNTDLKMPLKTTEYLREVENDSKLILLKLPSMPFMKKEDIIDIDDQVNEKSTNSKSKDTEYEGYVGKMRLMRSGRVKLLLGEIELELVEDKALDSYTEAATIKLQENMADLNILGKIERSMVFSPAVNTLAKK